MLKVLPPNVPEPVIPSIGLAVMYADALGARASSARQLSRARRRIPTDSVPVDGSAEPNRSGRQVQWRDRARRGDRRVGVEGGRLGRARVGDQVAESQAAAGRADDVAQAERRLRRARRLVDGLAQEGL